MTVVIAKTKTGSETSRVLHFLALYEDASKMEAAAKARGFVGEDGESWHDFVDAEDCHTSKRFGSFDDAVAWVRDAVNQHETVFGVGEVIRVERMESRCDCCICEGSQRTYSWIVSDTDVDDEYTFESMCV